VLSTLFGRALELLAVAEPFNLSKVFLYVSMGGQEKGKLSGELAVWVQHRTSVGKGVYLVLAFANPCLLDRNRNIQLML
jgi:hypothetical protein